MRNLLLSATALSMLSVSAFAADLPQRTAPALAPVPAFTWTGGYVGITAGLLNAKHWGGENNGDGGSTDIAYSSTNTKSSALFGVTAGYNYQMNNIVLGIETDVSFASNTGRGDFSYDSPNYGIWESKQKMFGTLRGRLGYAFDKTLVYGTAGLAFGVFDHKAEWDDSKSGSPSDWECRSTFKNRIAFAPVIGAGVEQAFTKNVTAKIEVLYAKLGKSKLSETNLCGCRAAFKAANTSVRAGINYKF